MRTQRGTGRGPAPALVALTFVVAASVGRCDLPQPRFPTLGSAGDARHAVASERSEQPRALAAAPSRGDDDRSAIRDLR